MLLAYVFSTTLFRQHFSHYQFLIAISHLFVRFYLRCCTNARLVPFSGGDSLWSLLPVWKTGLQYYMSIQTNYEEWWASKHRKTWHRLVAEESVTIFQHTNYSVSESTQGGSRVLLSGRNNWQWMCGPWSEHVRSDFLLANAHFLCQTNLGVWFRGYIVFEVRGLSWPQNYLNPFFQICNQNVIRSLRLLMSDNRPRFAHCGVK